MTLDIRILNLLGVHYEDGCLQEFDIVISCSNETRREYGLYIYLLDRRNRSSILSRMSLLASHDSHS